MRKILFFIFIISSLIVKAQDTSLFVRKHFTEGTDTLSYRILLPESFDVKKKYPLVLFLHGSGERGNDNALQLVHGAKLFLEQENREKYPAIVVFPQCPKNSYWGGMKLIRDSSGKAMRFFPVNEDPNRTMGLLIALVDFILREYPVKKSQVYVGGLSMGGMGTFELAWRRPSTFAAAFPICGGGNPETAVKLKHVKWWVFHGAKDNVVLPGYSEMMVTALKREGAKVKFTLYPEANHNSWDPAFAEPGLLKWLFDQKRR